ncbi:2-dehydro-3-deoxygalactonokinase [Larsenimonas rhizosphaerae]|uniref:2-dehydro-3-deoxygalactonokinase n=1 Tax=Larsenimonas rhizosphaerae TaxID=2944682 RepID=UPI002033C8B5|nr:2-dehydro-3-deoxygalactonokinase [Larsenimonas rhizosphaerae]
MSQAPRYIVVDWGTSNFRAFLVDAATGECLDDRRAEAGIKALNRDEFPHYCARQLGEWRAGGDVPVYLAGMVGAARGWREAPQLSLPVTLESLADHCIDAPGMENSWIIPGAKWVDTEASGNVDVMRGEEIQIFGARALLGESACWFCLPGTHSKWATLSGDALIRFTTAMTGELYHAVRFHTLPGEPARDDAPLNEDAFRLGLERSEGEGGVLHALFEARSRHLYTGLEADEVGSFLSGVLIGAEVEAMRALSAEQEIVLVGASGLSPLYETALLRRSIAVRMVSSDAATLAGVRALMAVRHR